MPDSANLLLSIMEPHDRERLAPHRERVEIDRGQTLIHARKAIPYVWFPEGGIASMLSGRPGERRAEVAVIGREGLCGHPVLLQAERPAHDVIVQVDGTTATRIPAGVMAAAMDESATLRRTLLRYMQSLFVQVAANSIANLADRLDVRLARWLLMCHDRVEGDSIAITHEFTAIMIGGQRSAVTSALHVLEGERLIQATRGVIRIVDRSRLERLAGDGYGFAEGEYRRLVAPFGKSVVAA